MTQTVTDAVADGPDLSPMALREVLQNLRLHQIELEMQNEELRSTQAALDIAQARYFDFYDLAPVGYVTVSNKAAILQANLTTAKLLGVSRAKLIGKALPGFIAMPDADSYYLLCKQALASGSAQSCELRMRHQPDGQAVWIKLQAIAATGDDGAAVIRMVLSNITSLKSLEERLISSEADTQAILDGASDAVFIANSAGRYQYVNVMATQLLGFSREELLGMGVGDLHPVEDRSETNHLFKQLLSIGNLRYEPTLKRRDGSTVCVDLNCTMLADGRLYGACRDITERKQAQAQLLANKQFRTAILDSVPSHIAVLDRSGTIVAVNQRWCDFALTNSATPGKAASHTAVGSNYLDICQVASSGDTDDSAALARDGILRVIDGSAPSFQMEYPCHSPTQQRWFSLTVTPLHMDNQAVVVTHTDITQRKHMEQAAKEASEHKFRLVADNTSDGILMVGADRQVQYVSSAYLKQLGFSQAEELGSTPEMVFSLIHPQERDAIVQRIECAIESKASELLYSYRARHRLGHYIWRENNARFQYDEFGNFAGVCIVARDITERRQADENQRIAAAAFETQEAMMITDARSVILRVNRAFTQVTGYTAEEAVGQTPQLLQSGHHDKDFYRQLWDTVRRTGSWQGEVWDRHKDGSVYPKWLAITAVSGIDGAVSHYIGTHFDLSERKRTEAAMLEMNRHLTQSRQQLRRLVAINESTLEKEKRHIAREVHDELGQVLTALRMDLSLVMIHHASQMPRLLDALNGMKMQVDRAIQGVRNVATSLRPAALDMGLVPSITWLCHEFTRRSGVVCELQAPDDALLDPSRAVVVFRIVQESLTNISKYAHASQVNVSLSQHGHDLWLQMRDNGIGFDLAAAAQRGSLGLLGMRERVLALGGQVEVTSTPGQGTVIAVVIPLATDVTQDAA